MKTTEVRALVLEVLAPLPTAYTEHVTDDVMYAIETTPEWRKRYDALCDELTTHVVNGWCGQWTANALGKLGGESVPRRHSTLVMSYSLIPTDQEPIKRKPKEEEARTIRYQYFRENKANLPRNIQDHSDTILQLLMDGHPVEEAFAIVQRLSSH